MGLPDHKNKVYMPQIEYRLITAMYYIACDGLHYCLYERYFDSITKSFNKTNQIWFVYTVNAYYDLAVSHWCKLFGSYSEPTHYYKLIETHSLINKLFEAGVNRSKKKDLKSFILNSSNVQPEEYDAYHQLTKEYRDRNLVHREHSPDEINDDDISYPKLDIAKETFLSLILLLINLARKYPSQIDDVNSYVFFYDDFSDRSQICLLIEESFPKFD